MLYVEGNLFSKEWNKRTSRFAFLKALVLVFERFMAEDRKPSSTYWATNHAYLREHAMPCVLLEWTRLTGLDATMFPWTEDEVATTWEEWRKTNAQYRDEYREELGISAGPTQQEM